MKDEILNKILENFLVTSDALQILKNLDENKLKTIFEDLNLKNVNIIDKITIEKYLDNNNEKNVVIQEKKIEIKSNNKNTILSFINKIEKNENNDNKKITQNTVIEIKREIIEPKKNFIGEEIETSIKDITKNSNINLLSIVKSFDIQKNKPDVISWVNYYKKRIEKIKEILKQHNELKNVYPLSAIPKNSEEDVGIIGFIYDKRIKEDGVLFIIEDGSIQLKVFVPKEKMGDKYPIIKDIPLDSVIGFVGKLKNNIFYANNVILPDVPNNNFVTVNDEVYIAFTGDWQIGNKYVIQKVVENFIKFINAKTGNSLLDNLARKIGYLSIIGDVVDGVGIYPEQNEELIYKSYEKQYEEFENILLKIPEYIKTIVIPGNHDIPRLAEPQPPLPKNLLKNAYSMKNIYFLSNPSYVLIHNKIKLLLYHGYVMDWFVSEIPYIRENGGYERAENIMKMQLMLRHLAPTHGSTPYVPYNEEDPLIISDVPNIFHTGHIHRAVYSSYKGIDLVNSSTFQDITPFQIELGHKPLPGILYLRNLSSSEVLAINLLDLSVIKIRDKL